ncbi:MAG TPA: helix-turn-helix domain-containing protein [Ignavibacteria bacterium]|nr:DNA-binding protein [Bacteroidota bacterium]HCN38321.1 DNA-binding protein [Bacteroidota bacterium]HRF66833.1 helix-turn-helix domain-containing protein [Ignavibacteria bacterium]HRJ03798.1 helix-turn-helix domain-containing protein [Ignavibacteria bacterium]
MKISEIEERLKNIESMLEVQKPKPMTFDTAAEYLGISKSYLYKLTSGGKIPHFKPYGKKIYFEKVSLDKWVYSKPVKGTADIEAEAIKYLSK